MQHPGVQSASSDPTGRQWLAADYGVEATAVFSALGGCRMEGHPEALAALERDPRVVVASPPMPIDTFEDPPWGLDRIDQPSLPLDGRFRPRGDGDGVTAYIIDTGVDLDHPEFEGRATRANFGPAFCDTPEQLGHGTHVAATVAGRTVGVAPKAEIVDLQVLSRACGQHEVGGRIARAMDWVLEHGELPGVVNLSVGGFVSPFIDAAVGRLARGGFVVVAAAGNNAGDGCSISPARAEEAIAVGATDRHDRRASFSNFGECVDIFAPGDDVHSALPRGLGQPFGSKSGTSMAALHVTRAAALLLGEDPSLSRIEVRDRLLDAARHGQLDDIRTGAGLLQVLPGDVCTGRPVTEIGDGTVRQTLQFDEARDDTDPTPLSCGLGESFGAITRAYRANVRGTYRFTVSGPEDELSDLLLWPVALRNCDGTVHSCDLADDVGATLQVSLDASDSVLLVIDDVLPSDPYELTILRVP